MRHIGFLPTLYITDSLSIGERLFADDMSVFLPVDPHSFSMLMHLSPPTNMLLELN